MGHLEDQISAPPQAMASQPASCLLPPSKGLRGRVRHVDLPFGSKGTTRTGVLLGEKDTGKLRAAPRCYQNPKASRYQLRDKGENCPEPECQCPPPALTPHQPKKLFRGGVCLARKTGCYICHVPHLLENSPTNCQRVCKASEGLQLVWQTSWSPSNIAKTISVMLRSEVTMCLNDCRPKSIWQAVKWHAISDGFKEPLKVRNP